MENTVYIWKPDAPPEMDIFECDEIPQPKPICSLCEENEATHLVRYKKYGRENSSEVCLTCYYDPDFIEILKNSVIISVTKIN